MYHTQHAILNSELGIIPFPHLYIENIFTELVYRALRVNLPPHSTYKRFDGYPTRYLCTPSGPFWSTLIERLQPIRHMLARKLNVKEAPGDIARVALIRDYPGYAIGPHTDSPNKLFSALFYLPPDATLREHGTTLYASALRDPGTQHYAMSEAFTPEVTVPFMPNTMFAFAKTDRSWHGVQPFNGPGVRDVLLLYVNK